MKREYKSGAAANPPAAPSAPSAGYPTEGDVLGGTAATVPGAHWFHMVTEAIVSVIEKAGMVPSNVATQFRDAIVTLGAAPGDIKATAAANVPDGWLECDGSAVGRAAYPALFAAVGDAYGPGDETTTFNLPDFRGRVVVGKSAALVHGDTGGAETHVLTTNEMPSHSHGAGTLTADDAGEHSHRVPADITSDLSDPQRTAISGRPLVDLETEFINTSEAGSHTHDISGSTAATGGGAAHNIMQPYGVATVVIKT